MIQELAMTTFAYRSFWLCTTMVLGILIMLAGAGHATRALAAGPTSQTPITVHILAGTLTANLDAVSLTSETDNGTSMVATYQMSISLIDATGSANGWNLALATALPQNATAKLRQVNVECAPGSSCAIPQNTLSYPIPMAANTTDPVSFLTAPAYSGMGAFAITAIMELSFPISTNVQPLTSPLTLMIGIELQQLPEGVS
jgi:hypothetical protein